MAEIVRRTLRFHGEKGREIVKTLKEVNTGQSANERLVEDIYTSEMLRRHFKKPLPEVLIMLISAMRDQPQAIDEMGTKTTINVEKTLSMLEDL